MTIRILHTADWQIGKQFKNVPGDAGAGLRLQRFETVQKIAEYARDSTIDAVLVAGDVFDDNAVSDDTIRRTLNHMAAYAGPWVLLPGNHDAAQAQSVWSRIVSLGIQPDNVILATEPQPIPLCDETLFVLPAPLQRRHESLDLTDWFDQADTPQGAFRVGLAHGSVKNRLPDVADSMNPIADTRAETARLDYFALGDWHGKLKIAPRTWYSGTPEQDRFRENDPGNFLLVELERGHAKPSVTVVPVGRFMWQILTFDIEGASSIDVLQHQLEALDDPTNKIVELRLQGMVDLEDRHGIDVVVDSARARFRHLRLRDTELKAAPSERDLHAMKASGYLQRTINRLAAIQEDAGDAHYNDAGYALRILYLEQLRLQGQQ